jgi:hypothetical protein
MSTHKPLVNGFYHDFASITVGLDGDIEDLIKEIKYAPSVERGKVSGTSMRIKGYTRGQLGLEANLIFSTRTAFNEFVAKFGERLFVEHFTITISYGKDGQQVITDKLEGCLLKKPQLGGSSGTDPLEVACDLDVTDMYLNGEKVLPDDL